MSEDAASTDATTTETSTVAAGEEAIDWKAETEKVRREAAGHRTQKQQYKTENEELKSQLTEFSSLREQHEQALATHSTTALELAQLKAALGAEIPVDQILELASRLKGETPEELLEDAQKLKGLLTGASNNSTTKRIDPSQRTPEAPVATGLRGLIRAAQTN